MQVWSEVFQMEQICSFTQLLLSFQQSHLSAQPQQRQSQGVFCPVRYVEKIRHLRRAGD